MGLDVRTRDFENIHKSALKFDFKGNCEED